MNWMWVILPKSSLTWCQHTLQLPSQRQQTEFSRWGIKCNMRQSTIIRFCLVFCSSLLKQLCVPPHQQKNPGLNCLQTLEVESLNIACENVHVVWCSKPESLVRDKVRGLEQGCGDSAAPVALPAHFIFGALSPNPLSSLSFLCHSSEIFGSTTMRASQGF